MKRIMVLLLAAFLLFSAVPAVADGAELSYEKAAEMAMYMRELAAGDFLALSGAPEELQRKAREWTAAIDDTPRLVVRLDIMNSAPVLQMRALFQKEHPMVSYEAQSSAEIEVISYALIYASLENGVSESDYTEIIQVNSLLNSLLMYGEEAEDGTALYLVLYDGASPLLILAIAENNAVGLTGFVAPGRELAKCADYGDVSLWFMKNGFPMTATPVLPAVAQE